MVIPRATLLVLIALMMGNTIRHKPGKNERADPLPNHVTFNAQICDNMIFATQI